MRAIGSTIALADVMWSITAIRVRGVMAAVMASSIAASCGLGQGSVAVVSTAPVRAATWRSVLRTAP